MIRPYLPCDKPQLLTLINLNIPHFFDPSEAADFADYLENQVETYFVMEEEDKIVGCGGINYLLEEATARISWDIVHPDYQGKGIGRKLIMYRIDEIKNNSTIKVIIVRTTQLTYQFYEKIGFNLKKIEKDFWAKGFDLYYMKYTIGTSVIQPFKYLPE